jgi:hypothetical protein
VGQKDKHATGCIFCSQQCDHTPLGVIGKNPFAFGGFLIALFMLFHQVVIPYYLPSIIASRAATPSYDYSGNTVSARGQVVDSQPSRGVFSYYPKWGMVALL